MDPPNLHRYTVSDFLSEQKIAVKYDRSQSFIAFADFLLKSGFDSANVLKEGWITLHEGMAICYYHNKNQFIQKSSIPTFISLGYTVISAEELLDIIVLPDIQVSDFLNFLEE